MNVELFERPVLFVALLVACSSSQERKDTVRASDDVASAAAYDTGAWTEGSGEDAEASAEPQSWAMSGSIVVRGGVILETSSGVTATVVDTQGAALCQQRMAIMASQRVSSIPDGDVDVWWTFGLEELEQSTCDQVGVEGPLGDMIGFGIGPLHPEVEAVLGSEAADGPAGGVAVWSTFASIGPDSPVWVFGIATAKGVDESPIVSVDDRPVGLPDGEWRVRSVYRFPYEG